MSCRVRCVGWAVPTIFETRGVRIADPTTMSQYQAILDHVPSALLVVVRLSGLAIYGPVFGSRVIPGRVKVSLVFLIALAERCAAYSGWMTLVISLPFKLLLFVLVDGWQLVVETLMTSVIQPEYAAHLSAMAGGGP